MNATHDVDQMLSMDLSVARSEASHHSTTRKKVKLTRRLCKVPGCSKLVKSQGLCQRHGARPRTCKFESCHKQAQGNFDGMCKSHFNSLARSHQSSTSTIDSSSEELLPPPPEGESVYDRILPDSLRWIPRDGMTMPLVYHLSVGFEANKPLAWHRNEERRARGLWPVNHTVQLEGWERELVWMEILLLAGNASTSFRHLARAWGRDKGFHMVLAHFICNRRGDVERKQREPQDSGKSSSASAVEDSSEKSQDSFWCFDSNDNDSLTEAIAAGFLDFDTDDDDFLYDSEPSENEQNGLIAFKSNTDIDVSTHWLLSASIAGQGNESKRSDTHYSTSSPP